MRDLRASRDVIVRMADKNMGMCVVSRAWYLPQCLAHLSANLHFALLTAAETEELLANTRQERLNVLQTLGQCRAQHGTTAQFQGSPFRTYLRWMRGQEVEDAC